METLVQEKRKRYVPSQKPTYVRQGDDLPLQYRSLMLKLQVLNTPKYLEELKRVDREMLVFSFRKDELEMLVKAGIIRRMWLFVYSIQHKRTNELIDIFLKKHKRYHRSDILLLRTLNNTNNARVLSRLVCGDSPDQIFKKLRMEPSVMRNCFAALNRVHLIRYYKEKDHCAVSGDLIRKLLE
jgi:hypothetical protein